MPGDPGRAAHDSRDVPGGCWELMRTTSRCLAALAVLLAGAAVVAGWPPPATRGLDHPWLHALLPVVLAAQASVVLRAEPRNPIGPVLAAVAGFSGAWALAESWAYRGLPGAGAAMAFAVWGWMPALLVPHTVVLLLFPDGRWPGRRWRVAGLAVVAAVAACLLASAAFPAVYGPVPAPWGNPLRLPVTAETYLSFLTPLFALAYLGVFVAVASLVRRWQTGSREVRRQLAWPVLGTLLAVALAVTPSALLAPLVPFVVPTAVVAAIRWRGLYGVDRVLSRSLVYLAGSLLVLAVLLAVVTASGAVVGRLGGLVPAVLATAVLTAAFNPVRRWLQGRVDRMVYGRRGDPAAAVSRLGDRLSGMLTPDRVPAAIVEVIADSLGVRQVAVLAGTDGRRRTLAHRGGVPEGDGVLAVPLSGTEGPVGRLLVGPRGPGEPLTRGDRQTVAALAAHAGPAVHAALLAAEIRQARVALVLARDEERRRLRRDLHDRLGASLAGIGFGIAGVRRQVPDPHSARLARIADQAATAAREVRRIIEDLRPGPLEQLGLLQAMADLADRAAGTGLAVTWRCTLQDAELPLPVELAAYHIASEALTNVVRHAGARRCELSLAVTGDRVRLEVSDDGAGVGPGRETGVGVESMRSRAATLGGTVAFEARPGGGTVLSAVLPLTAVPA